MKPKLLTSIFFAIVVVDLFFFTVIRQYFPDVYTWSVEGVSYYAGISHEVAETLLTISGFVIALVFLPLILYFVYSSLKEVARSF